MSEKSALSKSLADLRKDKGFFRYLKQWNRIRRSERTEKSVITNWWKNITSLVYIRLSIALFAYDPRYRFKRDLFSLVSLPNAAESASFSLFKHIMQGNADWSPTRFDFKPFNIRQCPTQYWAKKSVVFARQLSNTSLYVIEKPNFASMMMILERDKWGGFTEKKRIDYTCILYVVYIA